MIKMLKSIIHPFKTIKRMADDEKQKGIDELINRRIYIANDINDTSNNIYLFCDNIPILTISDESILSAGTISLDDARQMMTLIKDNYRKKLNNKSISQ